MQTVPCVAAVVCGRSERESTRCKLHEANPACQYMAPNTIKRCSVPAKGDLRGCRGQLSNDCTRLFHAGALESARRVGTGQVSSALYVKLRVPTCALLAIRDDQRSGAEGSKSREYKGNPI